MRIILFAVLALVLGTGSAHWKHGETEVNNYYTTEVTEVTEVTEITEVTEEHYHTVVNESDVSAGYVALSMLNFDLGTNDWQGSCSVGFINSKDAFACGVAKKLDDERVLFSGAMARESKQNMGGVGIHWRF